MKHRFSETAPTGKRKRSTRLQVTLTPLEISREAKRRSRLHFSRHRPVGRVI